MRPLLSSPSQRHWESFERGTKSVLHNAQLTEYENLAIRERQTKQERRGPNTKRKLRKGGTITVAEARALKQEKAEKRVKEDMQRIMTKERKAFSSLKNQAYKEGVEWRKRDKENKQAVKNNKIPPWVDLIIRDPWEQWKDGNPEWVKQDEEKKRRKREQDKIDPRLLLNSTVAAVRAEYKEAEGMADFIRFSSDGEDDESEENFSENDGDSDNSEDVDFTTVSHYFS
jgi:hypothetical protein